MSRWAPRCLVLIVLFGSTPAFAEEPGKVAVAVPFTLHVESPYVVDVDSRAPEGKRWETVCTSPCDAPVSPAGLFRIRGRGVTTSLPFRLDASGGSAAVRVAPGSKNKERTGWFVVGGGAAAVLVGAVVDAAASGAGTVAGAGGPGDSGNTSNARVNFVLAGTTLILAGLAAAVWGGSLVVENAHSAVRLQETQPAAFSSPSSPSPSSPSSPLPEPDETRKESGIGVAAFAALDGAPALIFPAILASF